MKQLYLKNQAERVKLENVRKYKVDEHNYLVDEQKKAKKAKDTEAQAHAAQRAHQSHLRNGTYPPKGFIIPNSEQYKFKKKHG